MIVNGEKDNEVNIRPEPFTDIYEVHSEIGRGKFAVVKRCVHRSTGVNYAAKFLHKRRRGKDCRQEALHEIHMLHLTASNARIIDLLEVYETSHDLVLVTEYVSGGELFQLIDVEGHVDEKSTVRLLRQILEGIAFLHNNNILHLDIKPQNILLTDTVSVGDVKLCDLGLARPFNSGADIIEIVGTLDYVAPEVLDYVSLDSSCDMWSVGVLTYVMLTGCSPFAGDSRQETLLNISQVNLEFPQDLFESVSPLAIDFIRKLLVRNTCKRLSAEQCLQHPWLTTTTDNQTTTTTVSDYTTVCTDTASSCTDSSCGNSCVLTTSVDCSTTPNVAATTSDTIAPTTTIPVTPCLTDITPDIPLPHSPCPVFRPPVVPSTPVPVTSLVPTTPVTSDTPVTPLVPSTPVTPAASPSLPRCRISSIYDSPSGQRRALISTLNVDEVLTTHEPAKKCRCDVTDSQHDVRTGVNNKEVHTGVNNKENKAKLDAWSQLCVETVAATELCFSSTTTTTTTTTTSAMCLNVSVA